MDDNSHLTALKKPHLGSAARWLQENGHISGRALDFGCGHGGDARRLGTEKYDPYWCDAKPVGKFDTVICINVLNTKPKEDDRKKIEDEIIDLLLPGGVAYIAVRNDKYHIHGLTTRGTWQGMVQPTSRWKLLKKTGLFRLYYYINRPYYGALL